MSDGRFVEARALFAELESEWRLIAGEAGLGRRIDHSRIQKSGLALAGHLVGVVPQRVQILGETEMSYLEPLGAELRRARLEPMFALSMSCVVVTRGIEVFPELIEVAERTGTPVFLAEERSSATIARIHALLDRMLAPRLSMHGVMIEVHGLGILLVGPSGIGKSECALVLLERGHRLVADDRVELVRMPDDRIIGSAVRLLKDHIEIRGLGILNVRDLFGAAAVRDEVRLDLVVELARLEDGAEFDRLGIDDRTRDVLGVAVSSLRLPVYPGRDMGVLLEVATRNELLKRRGHHSARTFAETLERGLFGRPKD